MKHLMLMTLASKSFLLRSKVISVIRFKLSVACFEKASHVLSRISYFFYVIKLCLSADLWLSFGQTPVAASPFSKFSRNNRKFKHVSCQYYALWILDHVLNS